MFFSKMSAVTFLKFPSRNLGSFKNMKLTRESCKFHNYEMKMRS
jgi:hypothetical protein